jgi:hypothetical protein
MLLLLTFALIVIQLNENKRIWFVNHFLKPENYFQTDFGHSGNISVYTTWGKK